MPVGMAVKFRVGRAPAVRSDSNQFRGGSGSPEQGKESRVGSHEEMIGDFNLSWFFAGGGGGNQPGTEVAGVSMEVRGDCFLKGFRRKRQIGDGTEVVEVVGVCSRFCSSSCSSL